MSSYDEWASRPIKVRDAAALVPELVQWVVQKYGPQPEEWTKEQYWDFVQAYENRT